MILVRNISIALLVLHLSSTAALCVEPPSKLKVQCASIFKKWILPHIVPNLSNKTIVGVDNSDPTHPYKIVMKMGERLGFGMKGAVYVFELQESNHPALVPFLDKPVKFVFKTSHQGRWFGSLHDKFQKILIEEKYVYDALIKSLPQVEKDPVWYPKEPNWNKGTLPIAPVLASVGTKYGQGLIKLMLPGLSVRDIAKKYKSGNLPDSMVKSMEKSLRDWYQVSQAASNNTLITPLDSKEPRHITSLDINPENMVYVQDPYYLNLLGIKNEEPTFAAYELGEPALTSYRHEDLSEDGYRKMWENFVMGIQ